PDNLYGHVYGESRLHRHHEPRGPWTGSPCRSNRHTLLRNRRQLEWISSDRNYTGRRYHSNRTEAIPSGRLEAMTAGAEAPVTQSDEVPETSRSENPEMKATYKATTASDGSYQLKRAGRARANRRAFRAYNAAGLLACFGIVSPGGFAQKAPAAIGVD